jgi:hypothetical protein
MTDDAVVQAMLQYGGSFVRALALCWQRADPVNQQRLRLAFGHVWAEYRALAQRAAAAHDQLRVE